ncbi:rhodanese-like domain-containing protein [Leptospira limi]|uniref:Rhodanese-like domain-containing protein n=1 Tax=Leptospira limi TaxID=2950023 RepID=A0ABT3M0H0_9LEPT|nr:rhodanese-like domain-containing protein [Leptospira limi]MCW7463464.1 rhodanese-like domain-containing protein [Leptospira limi]
MKTSLQHQLVALFTAGFLGACGGNNQDDNQKNLLLAALALSNGIKVNTAVDLARESNDDYNLNEYGLITPQTLGKWVNNWSSTKPNGITGKLVILQNGPSATVGKEYIAGNGNDVVVYSFTFSDGANALDGGDGFSQKRNSGLSDTVSIIANGPKIDAILNRFGIDPINDLVVFVSSANASSHVQGTLRGFYSFRYWGFDHKNLAFLNGTLPRLAVTDGNFVPFSATTNTPPNLNNRYSVKSLRVDNTILMLPVEDVIKAVKDPNNVNIAGITSSVFVSDARSSSGSSNEYNGVIRSTTSEVSGKYVGFEGHIKGARDVPWTGLLDTEFRFKPKSDLKAYYDARGYQKGQTAIQLCRTNNRSQVTGFSYIAILGYPSTYYDGSWIEWGSLTGGGPAPKLPPDSPYRTDVPELSDIITYNVAGDVDPNLPTNLNSFATTSRKIIEEDKAYKR